ncbi:MAG: asparaginase [Flavobacteriales bacterium]|mgnify:FL=1|jgi:L-asparaginase|nr:asparaginase [Schleiferiaceae bacterium]|tara:strand:+ start:21828 stop:22868 length:1041 start_codon:yes stop_codon:yes gene_type:complete
MNLLLIYTGGTVGMVQNDEGSLRPFDFDALLSRVPEIERLEAKVDMLELWDPMDSSDFQPAHWALLAEAISARSKDYHGFVILHGTDTMAYTASALSFMLMGLGKPVILTGSQLPIGVLRSDARENLMTALELAQLQTDNEATIQEVSVYFENKLYRGNRVYKKSSQAFDAFDSPNWEPLAIAGVSLHVDKDALIQNGQASCIGKGFSLATKTNPKVAVLTLFPGMDEDIVRAAFSGAKRKAIVMLTYGSGNAPNQPWFNKLLHEAQDNGLILINASQCKNGGVSQPDYAASDMMRQSSVLSAGDMTLEATLVKTMWLLGQGLDSHKFTEHFLDNLCGERKALKVD